MRIFIFAVETRTHWLLMEIIFFPLISVSNPKEKQPISRTFRRIPLALITTILTVLLLFSCLLGLKLGYLSVSLSGIVSILASHLLGSALPSDIAMGIADAVWDLRLPRILLALAVW